MTRGVARWGRAGALYDLVASAAFLTPWTASGMLGLFGTVVVMWSIARWRRPEPLLIDIDTAGRAVFSLHGQTWVLAFFLALELFWGAAQLRALLRR